MKIKISVRYKINAISTEITNSNWYSKISMLLFKAQEGRGSSDLLPHPHKHIHTYTVISGKYYH